MHPSVVDNNNQGSTLSRRADIGKLHLRRPFIVSEVEVLVQEVENLGTGRCVFFLFTT